MNESKAQADSYFALRGVNDFSRENAELPAYFYNALPVDKNVAICDLGCGFGRILQGLKKAGYENLVGVDQAQEAIAWCQKLGLSVQLASIADYLEEVPSQRFDMVIMSHVLEHIDKPAIIPTLRKIKEDLLKPGGSLFLMVPNGQSATGCYWAYEDFTHSTLFTAGSLSYVLQAAGFKEIELIDADATAGLSAWRAGLRRLLLGLYRWRLAFWNKATASSFHKPSPQVFSFEVKMKAR